MIEGESFTPARVADPALDDVLLDLKREIQRARLKHQPIHSYHEGFGVIYEEFIHELAPEIFRQHVDKAALEKEAIQTAAMAIRFVLDLLR